jgi:hypothetical protein
VEKGFQEAKHYITPVVGVTLIAWLLQRYIKARLRAGQRVGPPVLITDDVPLPPDDLHAVHKPPMEEACDFKGTEKPGSSRDNSNEIDPVNLVIIPEVPRVADPSLSHHPALSPENQP